VKQAAPMRRRLHSCTQRNDRKPSRRSSMIACGCSHAAKCARLLMLAIEEQVGICLFRPLLRARADLLGEGAHSDRDLHPFGEKKGSLFSQ
jgi:hypothetical protein